METALLVTRTCTIAILIDRFCSAACSFMFVLAIIARMATGTIRLVSRELPVDEVCVGQMATGAWRIATMIQGLIRQSRMHEDVGQPPCRGVTKIAFLGCYEVTAILANGECSIVAGRTGSDHLRMIHANRRHPRCRSMAIFADIGGQ